MNQSILNGDFLTVAPEAAQGQHKSQRTSVGTFCSQSSEAKAQRFLQLELNLGLNLESQTKLRACPRFHSVWTGALSSRLTLLQQFCVAE